MKDKILNNIMNMGSSYTPPNGTYRVSELPYCLRKAFFLRKKCMKIKTNGVMFSGTLFHEAIPKLIKGIFDKEPLFEVETTYTVDGITIIGHADMVTDNKVWEWKFSGSKPESQSGLPLSYYSQANAYAKMLNKPDYSLVIVNRHDLHVSIIDGEVSSTHFDILVDRAKMLDKSLKYGNVPDGPAFGFECKFCPFLSLCFEGKNTSKPNSVDDIQLRYDAESFL